MNPFGHNEIGHITGHKAIVNYKIDLFYVEKFPCCVKIYYTETI